MNVLLSNVSHLRVRTHIASVCEQSDKENDEEKKKQAGEECNIKRRSTFCSLVYKC